MWRINSSFLFIFTFFFYLLVAIFIVDINGKYILQYKIKFTSKNSFFVPSTDSLKYKQVSSFKKASANDFDVSKLSVYKLKSESEINNYIDSLSNLAKLPLAESEIKESPYLINYPINGVYPLDAFFKNLAISDSGGFLYRIAHYGDSQIEGDRITYELRKLFQTKFPGGGVGYIPMKDITDPVSYIRNADQSWQRYTIFTNRIKGYEYGQGGSVFRYSPSLRSKVTLKILSPYQKVFLYYGHGSDSSSLEVYSSKNTLLAKYFLTSKKVFNILDLQILQPESNLIFVFNGPSPSIYGVSFDNIKGIQFDNYGLRGQAGDGLMLIPEIQLKEMYSLTNTKMAILQFGGNVVPGLRNEKMVNFYGDVYKKLYLHMQSALTNGSLLIIGINDVSRSVNGTYESYPNISKLRYIQKSIAVQNGMAFFDIYEFMGGENSVKYWAQKGLASRDGHFSEKGRQIVCRELFKALIAEYRKFLKFKSLMLQLK